jgi:hypothetical protein
VIWQSATAIRRNETIHVQANFFRCTSTVTRPNCGATAHADGLCGRGLHGCVHGHFVGTVGSQWKHRHLGNDRQLWGDLLITDSGRCGGLPALNASF